MLAAVLSHDANLFPVPDQPISKHVRVWDAKTGRLLLEPLNCRAWAYSAHFSPDGKQVLAASDFNAGLIWNLLLPDASEPVSPWLPRLAECIGGQTFDDNEMLKPADPDELFEIKRQIELSPTKDNYIRWAKSLFEQ